MSSVGQIIAICDFFVSAGLRPRKFEFLDFEMFF